MLSIDGVRAAILSLAGTYIYDYVPSGTVRCRVNAKFSEAEHRLRDLLQYQKTLDSSEMNECTTIAAVLSTQDVSFSLCRTYQLAC